MANRFWVKATAGNWDATVNNWAATSGGTPGVSIPTASDDVFFNANGVGNCTDAVASRYACNNFNIASGYSGMVTANPIISGNLSVAGGTFHPWFAWGTCTVAGNSTLSGGTVTGSIATTGDTLISGASLVSASLGYGASLAPADFTMSSGSVDAASSISIRATGVLLSGGTYLSNSTQIRLFASASLTVSGANITPGNTFSVWQGAAGTYDLDFGSAQYLGNLSVTAYTSGALNIIGHAPNVGSSYNIGTLGATLTCAVGATAAYDFNASGGGVPAHCVLGANTFNVGRSFLGADVDGRLSTINMLNSQLSAVFYLDFTTPSPTYYVGTVNTSVASGTAAMGITFIDCNKFVAGSKVIHSFANSALGYGTHRVRSLIDSTGTLANPAVLQSVSSGLPWGLNLEGVSNLGNKVTVKNSNASYGNQVLASGSSDLGGNTNWFFALPVSGTLVPFFGADNRLEQDTASCTPAAASGFPLVNLHDERTYTLFKFSSTATSDVLTDAGSGKTASVDYLAILNHNLFTAGATATLSYSSDGVNYADYINVTPADNFIVLRTFLVQTYRYWRLRITGGSVPIQMGVAAWGKRVDLPYGPMQGYDPQAMKINAKINQSQTGNFLGVVNSYAERRQTVGNQIIPDSYIRNMTAPGGFGDFWENWASHIKPFFYIWTQDVTYEKDGFYAIVDSSKDIQRPLATPVSTGYRNLSFDIVGLKEGSQIP